ncbi:MAG TPA: hypothetical protein VHL58_17390 [Thermoanaerobaculia bacterium]|nr:hypothetical protein [Thermoanaerobaculia bacterium]
MRLFMLATIALVSGCCTAPRPAPVDQPARVASPTPKPSPPKPDSSITVIGVLTDEGVECQALRSDSDQRLYTIGGNHAGLKNGDHVKVTGTVARMSVCQQGVTLAVTSIEKAE